jgi:hypothetical protein
MIAYLWRFPITRTSFIPYRHGLDTTFTQNVDEAIVSVVGGQDLLEPSD